MSILLFKKLLSRSLELMLFWVVRLVVDHADRAMHGGHLWASHNGVAEVNLPGLGLDVAVLAAGTGVSTTGTSSSWLEVSSRLRASVTKAAASAEATTSTGATPSVGALKGNCSLLLIDAVVII